MPASTLGAGFEVLPRPAFLDRPLAAALAAARLEPDFLGVLDAGRLLVQRAAGLDHAEPGVGAASGTVGVVADVLGHQHDPFVALPAEQRRPDAAQSDAEVSDLLSKA